MQKMESNVASGILIELSQ